jgi:hypothetical protein
VHYRGEIHRQDRGPFAGFGLTVLRPARQSFVPPVSLGRPLAFSGTSLQVIASGNDVRVLLPNVRAPRPLRDAHGLAPACTDPLARWRQVPRPRL